LHPKFLRVLICTSSPHHKATVGTGARREFIGTRASGELIGVTVGVDDVGGLVAGVGATTVGGDVADNAGVTALGDVTT